MEEIKIVKINGKYIKQVDKFISVERSKIKQIKELNSLRILSFS